MTKDELKCLLEDVKNGKENIDSAISKLQTPGYQEMEFAKIDTNRELRTGYPEIIYCQGKTPEQVRDIIAFMMEKDNNILGTRATPEMYECVKEKTPQAEYHPLARTIVVKKKEYEQPSSYIAVVTAGTSDIPVAEEAAITAEIFGNKVVRINDVGVAGIHRLFSKLEILRAAKVLVVVAGMEGALPSAVGGLVDKPVLAVPTSVGYGANFFGLSALLGMLTSCASGVSVVNIDNGFGAGYMASIINKLK